uniref:SbsA Ig-like domain-containing protein n=1 Tax=Tanacetum cinerariifolium TaxID=118510 RepID=A0A6L2N3N8_TANCI|nr:hypothetical protein [Tanacetum cinerariifolium]
MGKQLIGPPTTQRGGRLAGNVLVSGNTLTFDPTRDFRVGEELSVTATTGIQNSGGVALAAPQVYRLRVRPVGGTGVFGARTTVAVGGQPAFLVTADVDGDNDLDLLTANQFDNTVSVRLNNGQGIFSGGSTVVVGSAPTSVEAADVDGDGDLDLLCSNKNSATVSVRLNNGTVGTVSVRLNNGAGAFGGSVELTIGIGGSSVALADLDGDGDLDMLVAASASGTGISVFQNTGAGVFNLASTYTVPAPYHVTAADVDGDGDLDMLATNYFSSAAEVRLNNGTGSPLAVQVPRPDTRMTAWPNPTRSRVQLTDVGANSEVLLLDAVGRVMMRQTADGAGNAVRPYPARYEAGPQVKQGSIEGVTKLLPAPLLAASTLERILPAAVIVSGIFESVLPLNTVRTPPSVSVRPTSALPRPPCRCTT